MIRFVTPRPALLLAVVLTAIGCGPPPGDAGSPVEPDRCVFVDVRIQHPDPFAPYAVSVAIDGVAGWFSCGEDGEWRPTDSTLVNAAAHACNEEGFQLSLQKAGELTLTTVFAGQHWFTTKATVESLPHTPEGDAPCDETGALELVVDNLVVSDECVTEAAKAEPPCPYGIGERACGSDGVWYGEPCNFHRDAPVGVCQVRFPATYCGAL